MRSIVFDIEADGLIENATKLHCLCWHDMVSGETGYAITYDEMTAILLECAVVIGHNIIRYDIPMVEKFLGINMGHCKKIDTLGLSWYLNPKMHEHGLDAWGKQLGIAKPEITDWKEGTIESYLHRCSEDVRINTKLWEYQWAYLQRIYEDVFKANRLIGYITFKLECAAEQERIKWRVDVEKCRQNLAWLQAEAEKKAKILQEIMPPTHQYRIMSKPKKMDKKDGGNSKIADKWYALLKERGLPEYHNGALKIITKTLPGNPASHDQVKEWLMTLGWKPITFKYVRKDYDSPIRAIPQLAADDGSGLCESVKELFEVEPRLEEFESFFVMNHRIGLLKGFLESINEEGFLKAEINGITNTLRFQHKKPIANLPTIPKKYWEMVRGVLVAPDDDHVLCGSDMSGLEDQTGRHYMYFYDPAYVDELRDPSYDPHLDIAVRAGLLTEEESNQHKLYEATKGAQGVSHKATRLKAKKVNFGAKYGAGAPKLALTANIPVNLARKLHITYWERNWSIKKVAEDMVVKNIDGQMWLLNPVSQFWLSLRAQKDIFATLNSSTGVYCFDTWVRHMRSQGLKLCCQYHDEVVAPVKKGSESSVKEILLTAINKTNEDIKLNVTLGISIDFGDSYADIH